MFAMLTVLVLNSFGGLLYFTFIYFAKFLFILQPPPAKLNSCHRVGSRNFESTWVTVFERDDVTAMALAIWRAYLFVGAVSPLSS